MKYRRAFTPGGSFFFTVVTQQRRRILASSDAVAVLREAVRTVRSRRPFTLDAMVVLPDHLHCIWTLPPGDADFATRWRLIKTRFTRYCDPASRGEIDPSRSKKGEQAVWQHRYWEHQLRDEQDFARHLDYIHFNPVKHGLVSSPMDWSYSSFRRYVDAGMYAPDWGCSMMEFEGVGHE